MSTQSKPVLVVLGAGPGLGMSVAHRFGAEKYSVALISRNDSHHDEYLRSLADAGVEAAAYTADATDGAGLRRAVADVRDRFGRIDVGYYGPMATDFLAGGDITTVDGATAAAALRTVPPAVDFASLLIPELTERGSGALLFAGGMSSVVPMPDLGAAVLGAAAVRNYAITLHAALAPVGVYAGTILVGALIERSDLHQLMAGGDGRALPTVSPDVVAERLWQLYQARESAEALVPPLKS